MPATGPAAHSLGMTSTTTTDPKVAAAQQLYAGFADHDMEAILSVLADDVDWAAEAASTTVPWYGPFRGRAEVPRFFEAIGANVEVTEFQLLSFTANDTDVVATIHWTYTVRATGRTASMHMQHWWRFGPDGRVVFFRGSEDSEQSAAAFRP